MVECVVNLAQGQLTGKICQDYTGKSFLSFQGIPYAKPPVGPLRFKAPVEAEPWIGVLDATAERPGCYAHHIYFPHVVGSEDCLYLNVYAPQLSNGIQPKPVVVCVHGGAFLRGSGATEFHGPDFLVSQDVVLVTFNYRVGIFGFLNLLDTDLGVPGNAGLKDQVMALKWIQKNVARFGGDPANVTLMGFSAGAASVHYLTQSPSTKGLFHRAICHSGSALCGWARATNHSEELVDALGIESRSERSLLEHLQQLPVEKLLEIQDSFKCMDASSPKVFAPVIETNHQEAIICESPLQTINSGNSNNVPLIIGNTTNEGIMFAPLLKSIGCDIKDYETFIPHELNVTKGSERSLRIAKRIKEFYEDISQDPLERNLMIRGDLLANVGVQKAAKLHALANKSPVYFYVFGMESKLNMFKQLMNIDIEGASHVDDVGYLFKTNRTPSNFRGTVEESLMKRMTRLWINFAKYGDPNGSDEDGIWKPIGCGDMMECLRIGNESFECGTNPFKNRMHFWETVYNSD